MWGCGVYTDYQGWSRLLKDLMGQILESWFRLDGLFAFYWLSTVVLYGPEVCSDTKTDVGQPH